MAKRRLTDRQQRQISAKKTQQAACHDTDTQDGTVLTHHGKELIVMDENGETLSCQLRQNLGTIVCGDRVVFEILDTSSQPKTGIVVGLGSRYNILQKSGFGGKAKAVAANIDQVIVVCSLVPKPNSYLIDRYLVAAESLPAKPVIVINKIDLLDEENEHVVNDINSIYEHIGYRVLETSATRNTGLEELQSILTGATSILVGLSGVGKSSLVKDLLPDIDIRIGEISSASKEGKHTTTVSTLYSLPTGGQLIDSPGVWEYGLWDLEQPELAYGYVEFRPFLGHCRFNDCRHHGEPDCAIALAVADGVIPAWRYESYRRLLEQSR